MTAAIKSWLRKSRRQEKLKPTPAWRKHIILRERCRRHARILSLAGWSKDEIAEVQVGDPQYE